MDEQRAEQLLTSITGQRHNVMEVKQAHGGCISEAWHIKCLDEEFFLKSTHLSQKGLFYSEASGLKELDKCKSLTIPKVLGIHENDSQCLLLLEYFNLETHNSESQTMLGRGLAEMHRITADKFGFEENNYIGSTPQINNRTDNWVDFYNNCRLMPQAYMTGNDEVESLAEKLSEKTPEFFKDYSPVPSLLHGDLWGGNTARIGEKDAIIYDPAVYYGDRETDIAFTEFFSGFSPEFYKAYNEAWPLDSGYKVRKYLYQLYHSLNHLNLFGNTYLGKSVEILNYLLKVEV